MQPEDDLSIIVTNYAILSYEFFIGWYFFSARRSSAQALFQLKHSAWVYNDGVKLRLLPNTTVEKDVENPLLFLAEWYGRLRISADI